MDAFGVSLSSGMEAFGLFPEGYLASLQSNDTDFTSLVLRSIGFLLLLGAIGFGFSRFSSFRSSSLSRLSGKMGKINISDCKPLGNRQFLVIAEYGHNKFMLGVSPGKIENLAQLDSSGLDSEKSTS